MLTEIQIFGQITSWLEIFAMLTGLAGVWLTIKENIWCFPVGIVNVTLFAWLFFTPGIQLYADALLQCIYVLLLFYGWLNWAEKNNKKEKLSPVKITIVTAIKVAIVSIIGAVILAFFLQKYTNASYPWLDSILTCSSLAAQWMIAKKKIENWVVWIAVDIIYIPLYIVKHLPLTAFLYFIFLVLAIIGYQDWKKNISYREH